MIGGPISPDDVQEPQLRPIPDAVFEALNECVKSAFTRGEAYVTYTNLFAELKRRELIDFESDVVKAGWLPRLPAFYQAKGWIVEEWVPHGWRFSKKKE